MLGRYFAPSTHPECRLLFKPSQRPLWAHSQCPLEARAGPQNGASLKERSMTLATTTKHLKHFKDIALLLWKYGRSDLVRKSGLDAYLPDEHAENGRHPEDQKQTADAN